MRRYLLSISISICVFAVMLAPVAGPAGEPAKVLELWNGAAPGDKGDIGEEHDTTKPSDNLVAGTRLIRLGNVSKPTIALYRPPSGKDIGAAVVV